MASASANNYKLVSERAKKLNINQIIQRSCPLFEKDFKSYEKEQRVKAENSSFVVVGGAGTIGSAVVHVLISLGAREIKVVDISENNLVELVRDIRSQNKIIKSEIETYCLDCGSTEFIKFIKAQKRVDYLLNFSALKHVRAERDVYTLKRLIDVNVINSVKLMKLAAEINCEKYFCVSTDKAANPVNMMGASKLLMEHYIFTECQSVKVSTARFANVAFSDGSLLNGFENRIKKRQPLAVPADVRRFFVTTQEAGQLCVLSCLVADDKTILFPKENDKFKDISFREIAEQFLNAHNFESLSCESELAAKNAMVEAKKKKKWPCYFFESDTTGEKPFEEFFSEDEMVNFDIFQEIGVVDYIPLLEAKPFAEFESAMANFESKDNWDKSELVSYFKSLIKNFHHHELNKNLDQKM